MRGDYGYALMVLLHQSFNPRPSHEGRHNGVTVRYRKNLFQSTPLA